MIDEGLLDAIYAVSTREDAFVPLLARLAATFRCISAALVYVDPLRPAADVALGHGVLDEAVQARYVAEYAAIDPAPAALAALPIGTAASTDRLFSLQERASFRFVSEFYNPLGLYESLGAPIARADGQNGVVAVHRGCDRPAFSDHEIATFGELASHLARAVTLRRRFFPLAHAAEMRREMLDQMAAGMMAADSSGLVLEANSMAREIFARGDGLILTRSGRIRAVDRAANAALAAALAATKDSGPAFVVAPRADDSRPYVLKVTPAHEGAKFGTGTHLIQIADAQARGGDVAEALVHALGLSLRSAQLTAALVRGEDVAGYAARAGISPNTVKFHLKSAFDATGTHRQSELVGLAVAILRDLSL